MESSATSVVQNAAAILVRKTAIVMTMYVEEDVAQVRLPDVCMLSGVDAV